MTDYKYCPRLPLELNDNSDFISIEDQLGNVKQKIKMIILTNPGEKIMDPEFGLGIKKYLFEPRNGALNVITNYEDGSKNYIIEDIQTTILQNLRNQVKRYAASININDVQLKIDEFVAFLTINYSFQGMIYDELTLTIAG